MRRKQKIRRAILFISALIFPITFKYLSPYVSLVGAAAGIITGSVIVFLGVFISSLFFGRSFCAWVCPVAGIGNGCASFGIKKAGINPIRYLRFLIWAIWLGFFLYFIFPNNNVTSDFFYNTTNGISADSTIAFIICYAIAGFTFLMNLVFGNRSFCRYLCWINPFMVIGRKIRNTFKWPALKLVAHSEKCIDCGSCEKVCPMNIAIMDMVKKENMEHIECTLCLSCSDICKKKAIELKL